MDPKEIVRTGYDVVSFAHRSDDEPDDEYEGWLAGIASDLLGGARILDLGCGCGIPSDRWLIRHGLEVTGVDASRVQIRRARGLDPEAHYVLADMPEVDFPADSLGTKEWTRTEDNWLGAGPPSGGLMRKVIPTSPGSRMPGLRFGGGGSCRRATAGMT